MERMPARAVPAIALVAGVPTVLAPGSVVAQVAYTAGFSAVVVLAWLAVRASTGPARLPHALIAGALTTWLTGDLLYLLLDWTLGGLGDVSAADGLWVLGYPLLAAGLLVTVRRRAPGRLREAALDGLAMATVVGTLFWQFMILPAFRDNALSPAVVVTAFYPFGDVLLFATGAMLVFAPGGRRGPLRSMLAALTVTFLADVFLSVSPAWLADLGVDRLDALLLLANSLFAAALWHPGTPDGTPVAADTERLHPARVVFLGVALLALPALAVTRVTDDTISRGALLTAMVLLTVIILVRFTLVVREQERARSTLAHRATHDDLTGLINRQDLHARLAAALDRGDDVLVHFLDLDGFKAINDRYGHAAGDFVLTEVARRLRLQARTGDTVARLGGDEFVVVTDSAVDAAAMARRLREAVSAPMPFDGHDLHVDVSVGHARVGPQYTTSDDLLAAADTEMYREKAGHRSRRRDAVVPLG
ncbi:GGDEF domain-containing protein [Nucisporomicrobium flavum]|uniref:GGDEF domain-containing protein n=1 Tax=Nucisporomicrobium flavum TaxID=2785915 RepID=UPI0018F725A4|nr:GGDEF domain-containing protein [Nucisporomicrobium flavum]